MIMKPLLYSSNWWQFCRLTKWQGRWAGGSKRGSKSIINQQHGNGNNNTTTTARQRWQHRNDNTVVATSTRWRQHDNDDTANNGKTNRMGVDGTTKWGGSTGEMSGFERSGMLSGHPTRLGGNKVKCEVIVERIGRMSRNSTELLGLGKITKLKCLNYKVNYKEWPM